MVVSQICDVPVVGGTEGRITLTDIHRVLGLCWVGFLLFICDFDASLYTL